MKIQIDIPQELNKKLKIDKIKRELVNLQEVIILILNKHYEDEKKDGEESA